VNVAGFAFVDADMVVVNAIGGDLNAAQIAQFERDYGVIFGAEFSIPVGESVTVWIGGTYDPETGIFSPPPTPEVIEGASEIIG
jgi:hypothetical protein